MIADAHRANAPDVGWSERSVAVAEHMLGRFIPREGLGNLTGETSTITQSDAMAMNVRERISEVAVIRALGFQCGQVAAILFGEATVMPILGGVAGAVTALALWGNGIALGSVLGGQGYMQVTPDAAVAGALAIVGVSIVRAVIPVVQAVAISPAPAFRKVV